MRLTGFAKAFITIVILAVVGYAAWHYKGHDLRKWATGSDKTSTATGTADNSADFNALKNAPADPGRDAGSNGVQPVGLTGSGRLNRPLVVAINTWAGHAPASSSMTDSMADRHRNTASASTWTSSSC